MARLIKYKEDYITDFLQNVLKNTGRGTVLSHLDWTLLLHIYNGNVTKNEEKEIFQELFDGKTLWAPRETLPKIPEGEMGKTAQKWLKMAENLGICPVFLTKISFWVDRGTRVTGLLTAEKVKTLGAQGFRGIFLSPGSLVTPLAGQILARENWVVDRG